MERMIRRAGIHWRRSGVNCRHFAACFLITIFVLLLLVSCSSTQVQKSPAKGIYHIVKKGETAYSIARAYSISLWDLAEINNINDVSNLKEGSVLFIPDADQAIDDVMVHARTTGDDAKRDTGLKDGKLSDQAKPSIPADMKQTTGKTPLPKPVSSEESGAKTAVAPLQSAAEKNGPKIEEKPSAAEKKDEVKLEKGRFVWPVRGTVKTHFGIQPNKIYHNWIKLVCPAGTQVKAAASGTVIFSASLKDFGETIIIRHLNDFATVYTHLNKRYVHADQNVNKSGLIALTGEIDDMGNAYINFEIRLKGKARNPLLYLP